MVVDDCSKVPRRLRQKSDQIQIPKISDIEKARQSLNNVEILGIKKSKSALKLSNFFRILNIVLSISIIVGSSIILATEMIDPETNYIIVITTGLVMIIKTSQAMFQTGSKGIYFKYINIRMNSLVDSIREAGDYLSSPSEIYLFSSHVKNEINKLDVEMYKLTSGPESISIDNGDIQFKNYESNFQIV